MLEQLFTVVDQDNWFASDVSQHMGKYKYVRHKHCIVGYDNFSKAEKWKNELQEKMNKTHLGYIFKVVKCNIYTSKINFIDNIYQIIN